MDKKITKGEITKGEITNPSIIAIITTLILPSSINKGISNQYCT
jgi:hypothetical protein